MDIHFATAWELIAGKYPRKTVGICDGSVLTWGDYERRAACLAALLDANGIGADSKAGIYLHNSNEYSEIQFALFKLGASPVNVNYRYKADELVYLLENSDAEALFFQSCYAMRIWEIKDRLPKVKLFVQIDDGTEALLDFAEDYERVIRDTQPLPPRERDPDGVYLLYTGGTTGLPKGVMYPVGGFSMLLTGMGAMARGLAAPTTMQEYEEMLEQVEDPPTTLVGCPLMHGTGAWLGAFAPMMMGGTVVTTARLGLDPDRLWGIAESQRVTDIVIVGDAFARPMLESLDRAAARGTPYDISSVRQIISSGVMWSAETKAGLLKHNDMVLADIMGSSEGGMGSSVTTRDTGAKTARFEMSEGVKVFTDDDEEVEPGSGVMGRIATSGFVPLGYYKDPEKTAATFREIDGVRYSFPGDYATVEVDGSITLLGRGSVCINTGGEKVFPEEVEEVVKQHPAVLDCLVVGLPDDRFGERIVALAATRDGEHVDVEALGDFTRERLAGYKVPREYIIVDAVRRAVNGKADYKWASQEAARRTAREK